MKGKMENKDVVVGWGTLAMITAGIAQGKNRSGMNWFLLSMIFGPIALFFLLLEDKLKNGNGSGSENQNS
jgi:hypothetical protein